MLSQQFYIRELGERFQKISSLYDKSGTLLYEMKGILFLLIRPTDSAEVFSRNA